MKIKFQYGKNKVKISYDKFSDFYSKMVENISTNTSKFYKDIYDTMERISWKMPNTGEWKDHPGAIPANGHDIFNYVARYGIANIQLQAIMKLDGRLDFAKLSKAVRLSTEVEPVFGCRFVEAERPYWKPLDDLDRIQLCEFEETGNMDEAVQQFLESPLDMDWDPMVKVKLIRSAEADVLAVKVNHACCDGTGTKEYIQLLSEIYSCLDGETGVYIPVPRTHSRKDQDRLFNALGIADPKLAWIPGSDILIPTWPFPWKQGRSELTRMVVHHLPQGELEIMQSFAKAHMATINDLILTAFYRAMLEMGQPVYGIPLEIPNTIDLRRYLPDGKTEAIRNFSGSEKTSLCMRDNEPFSKTLLRVVFMMNRIKKAHPGLQSAIGLERIEEISFMDTLAYYRSSPQCSGACGDKCVPTLSNLGFISKSLIKFGKNVVTDAYIVPPVVRAPGFLLMASTYNHVLTLSAGYYEGTVLPQNAERLLNRIAEELVEGCKEVVSR